MGHLKIAATLLARLASDLYGGGFEEEELRHRHNDNFTQKMVQIADIFET